MLCGLRYLIERNFEYDMTPKYNYFGGNAFLVGIITAKWPMG